MEKTTRKTNDQIFAILAETRRPAAPMAVKDDTNTSRRASKTLSKAAAGAILAMTSLPLNGCVGYPGVYPGVYPIGYYPVAPMFMPMWWGGWGGWRGGEGWGFRR